MKEVARRAGVSVTTVSHVVNPVIVACLMSELS